MSYSKVIVYAQCIKPVRAEEKLHGITVSSFPHLNKSQAKKLEKELKGDIKAATTQSKPPQSTEELYSHLLRTLGNG